MGSPARRTVNQHVRVAGRRTSIVVDPSVRCDPGRRALEKESCHGGIIDPRTKSVLMENNS